VEALTNTVNHVKQELMPEVDFTQFDHPREEHMEPAEEALPKESASGSDLKWD
jgi:hypothetical protein